ncbi:hypothetical protein EXIGLDRAFT_140147 [Exidia glandulosa HHB12029]|uniref:Uncharacterized protein n=1 Tax=Exidia glandulosa HHB12029 TaxID=1314781 RepID=A0A165FX25_EXIGL|nr:hypothetical protein EXIGLDRAFT_140147 [Exidia glandulosa HHB12029]
MRAHHPMTAIVSVSSRTTTTTTLAVVLRRLHPAQARRRRRSRRKRVEPMMSVWRDTVPRAWAALVTRKRRRRLRRVSIGLWLGQGGMASFLSRQRSSFRRASFGIAPRASHCSHAFACPHARQVTCHHLQHAPHDEQQPRSHLACTNCGCPPQRVDLNKTTTKLSNSKALSRASSPVSRARLQDIVHSVQVPR